jgi:hypothetical protein
MTPLPPFIFSTRPEPRIRRDNPLAPSASTGRDWVALLVAAALAAGGAWAAQQPPANPPVESPRQESDPAGPPAPAPPPPSVPNVAPPPVAPSVSSGEAEAVVILRDGQRFSGLLVEQTPERITLRIAGIDTPIKTSVVERIEVLPPIIDRYRQMRALIDDADVERLILLAEWLRVRSQWDLSLREINQALAVQPDNPDALRLKVLVESQRELANRPKTARTSQQRFPDSPVKPLDFPLMSDRDINLVKVYEVDLKDPPRIVIPRETITQLIENYKADPRMPRTPEEQATLYRSSPTKVLDLMFRVRARELYEQVQVIDQPRSMRTFRDHVHRTWIVNSCATTRCHGGSEAGRLQLFNQRPSADATVYTNFIILDRYRLPDGKPLIDYNEPANSPLLQVGLPREQSSHPHPVVPGNEGRGDMWRPFFRNSDDLRFQEAVTWIKSMYTPRPEYPIEYTPPTPEAITPDPNEPPVIR